MQAEVMGENNEDQRTRILFFDEAVAFGGSVVVMSQLLQHIDRTQFLPQLVTSLDADSIDNLFRKEDVLCRFRPRLHYANRLRWMDRCPARSRIVQKLWAYAFSCVSVVINLPALVALHYAVWKAKPSVVHINNGAEGVRAARMFGIPALFHFHGMSPDLASRAYNVKYPNAAFVSISKYITNEAVKLGVPAERIIDIPNPAPTVRSSTDETEWRAKHRFPPDAIVFAHVGRLVRWKGQLEFLRAFSLMAGQCPQAFAMIVGDDAEGFSDEYPRSLRQLVSERGLNDRVAFTGHVDDVLSLMSEVDVVVHSSIEPEPFGLVITEAMAAGTAVVAARLGAPMELIDDGVTGLLVDPKDPEEFAAALLQLANDSARREAIGLAGQREARLKYSPESFARKIEAVYGSMLSGRSGVGPVA